MLKDIRDMFLCIILGTIFFLGVYVYIKPEDLGVWLQKVDNARFYNNAPIEYE